MRGREERELGREEGREVGREERQLGREEGREVGREAGRKGGKGYDCT